MAKIVFVDIEWEQYGRSALTSDRIVEIGAKKLEDDSQFIRFIAYDKRVCKQTRALVHLRRAQEDKAIPLNTAWEDLKIYVGDASRLVVWSSNTKEKLLYLSRQYGHPYANNKIVVFQDILNRLRQVGEGVSFERALIAMGAKYDPRFMHKADFDAACLKDLYVRTLDRMVEVNPILRGEITVCDNSSVFHIKGCSYLPKSNESDSNTQSDCFYLSGNPCKRCIGEMKPLSLCVEDNAVINQMLKIKKYAYKSVTREQMFELASCFGLEMHEAMGIVQVHSGVFLWEFLFTKEGYAENLRHENYYPSLKSQKRFHKHTSFPKDIYSLFFYISSHDAEKAEIERVNEKKNNRNGGKKNKSRQKDRKRIEREDWEDYYKNVLKYSD